MDDDDDYDGADAGVDVGGGVDDALAGLMHRISAISTSDPAELQRQFAELLGIPGEQAAFFLSAAGGNLEAAVNLFLDYSRASAAAAAPPPAWPPQRSAFYLDAQRTGVHSDFVLDGDGVVAAGFLAADGAAARGGGEESEDWGDLDDEIPAHLLVPDAPGAAAASMSLLAGASAPTGFGAAPPPFAVPAAAPPAAASAPPPHLTGSGGAGGGMDTS